MPSYSSYKRQMAVLDAKNDNIESWITVKGNHIPIMKGQSKEDAVKSFLAGKSDKASAKRESKPTSAGEATKKVVEQAKKNQETYKEYKKQETAKKTDKKLAERSNKPEHISEATKRVEQTIKSEKESPKESEQEYWWEPKTKEEGRFWLADTLASTEGFTEENFSKQDKEILKRLDKKFGKGWWKTDEPQMEETKGDEGWTESPKFEKITKQYMPKQGESDNELGEVLRSINRVVYRYYNDGDVWNKGYGKETVNSAVKHITELSKNKNIPHRIARGLRNALFELKTHGVKNPDKYETALKMLIQTIEFADEKDLEALSKIKRNG